MSRRMRTPCDAGFNCPYWGCDEDGTELCTAPEVAEKDGRYWVYPCIGNLKICPLVDVDTPLDEWLKSLDKEVNE